MTIEIFQIGEDFYSDGIEEWKMNNASQPFFFMKFKLRNQWRNHLDCQDVCSWVLCHEYFPIWRSIKDWQDRKQRYVMDLKNLWMNIDILVLHTRCFCTLFWVQSCLYVK